MMGGDHDTILFDKFEILECLKKDFGVGVYIANHIYLGKRILLKTLDREHIPDPAMLSRFQREAKTLAQLNHPNIINVLDFGTQDQFFYISFEYFKSRTLRQVIQSGELTEAQKRDVLVQLFHGLDYAHERQIIHRDIKPENVLLDENNRLKIADFGLAHVRGEESFTQQASIVGTPCYMSPEQIRGEDLTVQSDLFSAGVVAYELFSGINPFLGADVGATLNNILSRTITVAENIRNPDVRAVIDGLLQKNVNERLRSARQALHVLGDVDEPAAPRRMRARAEKPRRSFRVVGGLVVFAVVAAAILWLQNWQKMQHIATANQQSMRPDSITSAIAPDSLLGSEPIRLEQKEPIVAESTREQPERLMPQLEKSPGRLFVECQPWAHIYIDSQFIDTTPLEDAIPVRPGDHDVQLKHPNFPTYVQNIRVEAEKEYHLAVTLCSYLACNIYPWGDVYLNGELLGQTPFDILPAIPPGQHVLTVKNQEYGSIVREFVVAPGDTFNFSLNFEENMRGLKQR
ncbi:serine/threonine protein kinase [candidate division KSB1 bacterium]|nr:serine/threonine protein kinase [candidate division KSB1 bacterium]